MGWTDSLAERGEGSSAQRQASGCPEVEDLLFGEPLRSMSGEFWELGFHQEERKKDSGAQLKYLKDPPMNSK